MNRFSKLGLFALLAFSGLAWLGYYVGVNHVFPYSSIRPHRVSESEIYGLYPGHESPLGYGLKFETLEVTVEGSILLKGWFVHAKKQPAVATIILLHGIANCKQSLLDLADRLAQIGYNCILYDSRAHGESGGDYCTYGFYEKYDVKAFIDKAIVSYKDVGPIGIYGSSFGAAVAIQAMAADKRIRCGVVECTFATFREVAYDYWKRMTKLPIHFIVDEALKNSEQIAHFSVDSVRPEEDAKQIDCPVLVSHGDQDRNISWEYGLRVFGNLRSPSKMWYLVKGAGHYDVPAIGGRKYFDAMDRFFQTNLRQ